MENGRLVEKHEGYEELGSFLGHPGEECSRQSNWLEQRI